MSKFIEGGSVQGLHVLIDSRIPPDVIEEIIAAEPSVIQLRDKNLPDSEMTVWGRFIKEKVEQGGNNSLLIVNDRLVVAEEIDADGLHVGQSDKPVRLRDRWPSSKIFGVSASTVSEAEAVLKLEPTYFGVGPVFPTQSKNDAHEPIGLNGLKNIREIVGYFPIVAIGGMTLGNAEKVDAEGLAVIGAVTRSPDPRGTIVHFEKVINDRRVRT